MKGYLGSGTLGVIVALGLGAALWADSPVITYFSPELRNVPEHRTYHFTVHAHGDHRVEYHWWHQEPDSAQGHEIPNEAGVVIGHRTLTVRNALDNRDYNGHYWCVVRDSVTGEETTSPSGQLIVVTAPVVTLQPNDQQVALGETATFSVQADAGADVPISYQWYHGTHAISGARTDTLTLSNVKASKAGYYFCRVKTMGGKSYSDDATLTVTQ